MTQLHEILKDSAGSYLASELRNIHEGKIDAIDERQEN